MPLTDSLRDDILASVPSLRAFAISLSGNGDRADDLVQETLLRAIANIDSFQPGSNLPAWLFTILRNLFRSDYRKRRREVEDSDGSYAKTHGSNRLVGLKEPETGEVEFLGPKMVAWSFDFLSNACPSPSPAYGRLYYSPNAEGVIYCFKPAP